MSRVKSAPVILLVLAVMGQVRAAEKLQPVFFETNSFSLSKETQRRLDAVVAYAKAHPDHQIELVGSTDPRGTVQVNFHLRRMRSNAAKQYLIDHGVSEAMLSVSAAELPEGQIAPSEYAKLRRVSFGIIKPGEVAAKEPSKKPTEDPGKDNEPKDEAGRPIVNVLYWKSVNHALYILAKENGYFESEGLNVRLKESQLEANDIARDLASDEKAGVGRVVLGASEMKNKKYFIGAVCAYGFHDGLAKKLPLIEIGSMVSNVNTMIMKKDLLAVIKKDIRSFKGHSLGRVKGLPTDIDPAYLFMDKLNTMGLKAGQDYTTKMYDTWSDSFEAVARGEVDTATSLPPLDIEFIEKHPNLGLLYLRELFPFMPCCRQVVTRDNLRKNRDRYIRFERAVIRAHKFYVEHPEESIKILSKFLGLKEAVVKQILVSKGFTLTPDPMFKGAQAFRKSMASLGSKVGGDLREAIDTSLYEDALLSLQKEHAGDGYYAKMIETYRKAN